MAYGVYGHLSHDGNRSKREITLCLIPIDDIDDIDDHPARWVILTPTLDHGTFMMGQLSKIWGNQTASSWARIKHLAMSPPNDDFFTCPKQKWGECVPNDHNLFSGKSADKAWIWVNLADMQRLGQLLRQFFAGACKHLDMDRDQKKPWGGFKQQALLNGATSAKIGFQPRDIHSQEYRT